MLINNKKITGPSEEVVVIPRRDGNLVFKAKAVLKYDDFEKLCPRPEPPTIMRPGGEKAADPTDKKYLEQLNNWASNKTLYMILTSLSVTENLKWETVDMSKPDTWKNYDDELRSSGFSEAEIARIFGIVVAANGLDQTKIDQATASFLAGQQAR